MNKMIAARREIGMAVELLQTISRDENERARFRARHKFQMDMEHSLIVARDSGACPGSGVPVDMAAAIASDTVVLPSPPSP